MRRSQALPFHQSTQFSNMQQGLILKKATEIYGKGNSIGMGTGQSKKSVKSDLWKDFCLLSAQMITR